ncbi:P27 family phage terminase small subunit [Limnoglobus roseus]|uniref:Phage terminase small subunit P27 family n=1 Tax=Limnoglobus roseus TaxID=2598579 RepID=A0A5C1AI71_9BACT|nr:P27 family phage terminase small subunit [Limnoglobus roseus]QEL18540.1 hypothetical protein PX52LOC_05567 [Limnoglobus roseus]
MPKPPFPLRAEAQDFWNAHADQLERDGILTAKDLHAFAVCALTWQRICELQEFRAGADNYREMIQLANMTKQFHSFAKQFGLMPRERAHSKLDRPKEEQKDEFGL